MRLGEHDHIVGAWAEAPSGPGWSNRLVWVCIRSAWDGSHRVEALQPEEQSEEILSAFGVLLASSSLLLGAVRRLSDGVTAPPGKRPKRLRRARSVPEEGRR